MGGYISGIGPSTLPAFQYPFIIGLICTVRTPVHGIVNKVATHEVDKGIEGKSFISNGVINSSGEIRRSCPDKLQGGLVINIGKTYHFIPICLGIYYFPQGITILGIHSSPFSHIPAIDVPAHTDPLVSTPLSTVIGLPSVRASSLLLLKDIMKIGSHLKFCLLKFMGFKLNSTALFPTGSMFFVIKEKALVKGRGTSNHSPLGVLS